MALKKKEKKEQVDSWDYEVVVTKVKALDNGSVSFDMIVNGINIYGCFAKDLKKKDGTEFLKVNFPSYKGNNGKYYTHCFFFIDDETAKSIENQINSML